MSINKTLLLIILLIGIGAYFHKTEKPKNTLRIVIIGYEDSGEKQLPQKQHFTAVASHALNNCSVLEKDVEVMQEEQLDAIASHNPDIVLLAIATKNNESDADWERVKNYIVSVQSESTVLGATFMLVALTRDIQVHPDPDVRMQFHDVFHLEKRLKRFADAADVPMLPLAPTLQNFAEDRSVLLHGFDESGIGPWNKTGHREAGLRIADFICTQ